VTDSLAAYFKAKTAVRIAHGFTAAVLIAGVSHAALRYRQVTSRNFDKPVDRIHIKFPEQDPAVSRDSAKPG